MGLSEHGGTKHGSFYKFEWGKRGLTMINHQSPFFVYPILRHPYKPNENQLKTHRVSKFARTQMILGNGFMVVTRVHVEQLYDHN